MRWNPRTKDDRPMATVGNAFDAMDRPQCQVIGANANSARTGA